METYKVIKIISDTQILINAGANFKLKLGDSLDILTIGEEIIDPDTKQSLGTLDTIKATVEIVTLYPKMALCQKVEYETKTMVQVISNTINTKKVRRLEIDPSEISGGLSSDFTLHIGDIVRKSPS